MASLSVKTGKKLAVTLITLLLTAALCLVGCSESDPHFDSELTVGHCTIKTMLSWHATGKYKDGCYVIELPDNVVVALSSDGINNRATDKQQLRENTENAIKASGWPKNMSPVELNGISSYVKESQGYGEASALCSIDGVLYRGYLCCNVSSTGSAYCLAISPDTNFEENESLLKSLASSIRYSAC